MKKTVISHFYNEEYLLPWFLKHHKQIFDHGIMIDYASTDRSREIIKEICPTWDIIPSRNEWFDPGPVDQEVIDIENSIDGWKMCLNITEHLMGDYSILNDVPNQQLVIPTFVFVDKECDDNLTYDKPLYEQKKDGFMYSDRGGRCFIEHRQARSIHNGPIQYLGMGRHFTYYNNQDLVIFYYGWCPFNETAINRKLGMSVKMPDWVSAGRHHTYPRSWMEDMHQNTFMPWTRDLSDDMARHIEAHNRYVNKGM